MAEQIEQSDAASQGRLVIQAVMKTDVGKVRSENQDFGACTTPEEEADSKLGGRLLIVADGMGGHRGGATASRMATETIKSQYLHTESGDISSALLDALTRANAKVFSESQSNADLRGMGTTTSALLVRNRNAWFGHIGDSRIYLVRAGEIRQLTEDHSLVASLVKEGLITAEEAKNHPRRNVLQRSLGVAEEVEADVYGPFEVREGDIFILCSDGLHGLVKEEEMRDVVTKLPIEEAADQFVHMALDRGAPDNVTVIVAKAVHVSDEVDGEDTLITKQPPIDEADYDTARVPGYGGFAANNFGVLAVLAAGAVAAWLLWTASNR